MLIAAVTIMVRAAEMEGRSAFFWGGLTFMLCLACTTLVPVSTVGIGAGLMISYLAMFGMNVVGRK